MTEILDLDSKNEVEHAFMHTPQTFTVYKKGAWRP